MLIQDMINNIRELVKEKEFPDEKTDAGQKLLWAFVELAESAYDFVLFESMYEDREYNQEIAEVSKITEELVDVLFYILDFTGIMCRDYQLTFTCVKEQLNSFYEEETNYYVDNMYVELLIRIGQLANCFKKGNMNEIDYRLRNVITYLYNAYNSVYEYYDVELVSMETKFLEKLDINMHREKQYGQKNLI